MTKSKNYEYGWGFFFKNERTGEAGYANYTFHINITIEDPRVFVSIHEFDVVDKPFIDIQKTKHSVAIAGGLTADEIRKSSPDEFDLLRLHVKSKEDLEGVAIQWINDRKTRLHAEAINRNVPFKFL